jgi:hypothetical protein
MKLQTIAGAAAALLLTVPGLALGADKTYDLPAFTSVDISSGINADIVVGGTQSVQATAKSPELLDEMKVEVSNGKLKAYVDWSIFDIFSMGEREIRLTITAPTLDTAEGSAGADVNVDGMTAQTVTLRSSSGADLNARHVAATNVDLDASSGADLSVDGSCDSLEANSSSGSDIKADDLICKDANLNSSSGSDLDAHASVSVKANASSGSGIAVHGNPPKVEEEESSGGDIEIES